MAEETDWEVAAVRTPPARFSQYGAKLRAPVPSDHYIRRSRLLDLLDASVAMPLTVVSAPAGSGKTTLVAGWVTESTLPTAWVSLDSGDRDPPQFWISIVAALQTLVPTCGAAVASLLRGGAAVVEAVWALVDELDAVERSTAVFVIDDLHVVDDEAAISASLASFVQRLPTWLHVVLLSRRDPNLPRDRLRARGQLGEVRFAELRFSLGEARELVSRLTSSPSADWVDTAARRADGWAAGLQLAALAARSEIAQEALDVAISGDDLLIRDYVLHEVLAAETSETIEALHDVSVVDRVNPSLAQALTGRADAGELLVRAEARGLFVTRLGAEGWFEVHSLVRAALDGELTRRSPGLRAELHVRAARWCEQAGEVPAALDHWQRADRPRDALRLLAAEHAELYDSGREATVRRTIAGITPEVVGADLHAMIEFAWCHLLVDRRRFAEIVEQATWVAGQSAPDGIVLARLAMLQSIAAADGGSWAEGGALARQAMRQLGDTSWRDPLGRFGWNLVARELALSERWDDAGDEVRECRLALSRDPRRRLAFEGTRAVGHALAGRPIDALRVAAGVHHAASVANLTVLRVELAISEAIAHREIGDRDRAWTELAELAAQPAETMLYCQVLACLEIVQSHLDDGDLDAAGRAYAQAEALVDGESFGPDGRDWLVRVGTVFRLATGEIDAARRLARQIRDPFWRSISAARVHLAERNRHDALGLLQAAVPHCPRHEVVGELLVARAVNDRDEAVKHAALAVERATESGLLQTVAAEGPEVLELVERAAWQAPPSWLSRLRRSVGSRGSLASQPHLIEPLTERERDVLRYLPSRLTVREIADELFVSSNTLKFHLKVIYRKLGVSSRAEAAEAARRMAPLPPS
jgi:LuxR family transcriptional regulator, maltose regulon positive regulatory protein